MASEDTLHPWVEIAKRQFTDDERTKLAESGKALPSGGFPIVSVADLKNAIHAIGRATDIASARAHIMERATALRRTDLIPEEWTEPVDGPEEEVAEDEGTVVQKAIGGKFEESEHPRDSGGMFSSGGGAAPKGGSRTSGASGDGRATLTTTPAKTDGKAKPGDPVKKNPAAAGKKPLKEATSNAHTVVSGDTLSAIAHKNGMTLADLKAANPNLFDAKHHGGDLIHPGEKVNLKAGHSAPRSTTTKPKEAHVTPAKKATAAAPAKKTPAKKTPAKKASASAPAPAPRPAAKVSAPSPSTASGRRSDMADSRSQRSSAPSKGIQFDNPYVDVSGVDLRKALLVGRARQAIMKAQQAQMGGLGVNELSKAPNPPADNDYPGPDADGDSDNGKPMGQAANVTKKPRGTAVERAKAAGITKALDVIAAAQEIRKYNHSHGKDGKFSSASAATASASAEGASTKAARLNATGSRDSLIEAHTAAAGAHSHAAAEWGKVDQPGAKDVAAHHRSMAETHQGRADEERKMKALVATKGPHPDGVASVWGKGSPEHQKAMARWGLA